MKSGILRIWAILFLALGLYDYVLPSPDMQSAIFAQEADKIAILADEGIRLNQARFVKKYYVLDYSIVGEEKNLRFTKQAILESFLKSGWKFAGGDREVAILEKHHYKCEMFNHETELRVKFSYKELPEQIKFVVERVCFFSREVL